jgi:hypothetical protein
VCGTSTCRPSMDSRLSKSRQDPATHSGIGGHRPAAPARRVRAQQRVCPAQQASGRIRPVHAAALFDLAKLSVHFRDIYPASASR